MILDRHQEEKEEEQEPMRKSPSVCWERDDELMRREAHQQEAAMEMNGPQASVGGAQTRPGSPQQRPALFWTANVATIQPIMARSGWLRIQFFSKEAGYWLCAAASLSCLVWSGETGNAGCFTTVRLGPDF